VESPLLTYGQLFSLCIRRGPQCGQAGEAAAAKLYCRRCLFVRVFLGLLSLYLPLSVSVSVSCSRSLALSLIPSSQIKLSIFLAKCQSTAPS
jgi:hypothetical protein